MKRQVSVGEAICNVCNRPRINSRLHRELIQIKRKRQTTQQENLPPKKGKFNSQQKKTKGQNEIKCPICN